MQLTYKLRRQEVSSDSLNVVFYHLKNGSKFTPKGKHKGGKIVPAKNDNMQRILRTHKKSSCKKCKVLKIRCKVQLIYKLHGEEVSIDESGVASLNVAFTISKIDGNSL